MLWDGSERGSERHLGKTLENLAQGAPGIQAETGLSPPVLPGTPLEGLYWFSLLNWRRESNAGICDSTRGAGEGTAEQTAPGNCEAAGYTSAFFQIPELRCFKGQGHSDRGMAARFPLSQRNNAKHGRSAPASLPAARIRSRSQASSRGGTRRWVCAALRAPAAFKQPFLLEIARIPKVPRCEITASKHVRLGSFPRCSLENAEFFLHLLKHQAIDSRRFAFSQPPPPLMVEIPRHRLTPGHLVPMLL